MSDHTDTSNGNGRKLEHRLTVLETEVKAIAKNHLPHIQRAIADLKAQLNALKSWIMTLMGGVIVSLILLVINLIVNNGTD